MLFNRQFDSIVHERSRSLIIIFSFHTRKRQLKRTYNRHILHVVGTERNVPNVVVITKCLPPRYIFKYCYTIHDISEKKIYSKTISFCVNVYTLDGYKCTLCWRIIRSYLRPLLHGGLVYAFPSLTIQRVWFFPNVFNSYIITKKKKTERSPILSGLSKKKTWF